MKSIQSKIILLILTSIVIIISIVSFIMIENTENRIHEETRVLLIEMSKRIGSEFNIELQEVEKTTQHIEIAVESTFDLDALEFNNNYIDEYEVFISPIIREVAKSGVNTKSAYVFFNTALDGNSHDVWYTDLLTGIVERQEEFPLSFYDSYDKGEEWYFEPLRKRLPYWTLPYQGNVDFDKHIIYTSYTRPIIVEGEVIGVAGSDYDYSTMENRLKSIEIYEHGYAAVFDERGKVIYHPVLATGMELREVNDGAYRWMQDQIINSDSGYIEYKWIDGENKVLAYMTLNNRWTLTITLELDDVYEWINTLKLQIVIITMVLIVFTCLVGYRIGKYITRPLNILTEHVKVIGDGEYSYEIPIKLRKREDETGHLARSIEVMRQLQKVSFDTILKNNDVLELQIEKRTASLYQANMELEASIDEIESKRVDLESVNKKLESAIEQMEITQRQLIESEKLASLGCLVNRLGHEFNTPIGNFTTLITFLNKEKEKLYTLLDSGKLKKSDLGIFKDKFEETYLLIDSNILRLQQLVSRFKELDPQKHVTLQSEINVKDYINIIVDTLNLSAHIAVEILCEDNLILNIDAGKFSQILLHLLENAIQHGFNDLPSGLIVIDVHYDQPSLLLRIHDNGSGIPNDQLNHIFEPFFTGQINNESSGLALILSTIL